MKIERESIERPAYPEGGIGVDIEEIVKEAFRSSRPTLKIVSGYAVKKSDDPDTCKAEKESADNLIGYVEAAAHLIQKHYEDFLR